jgi:hypothetical protein
MYDLTSNRETIHPTSDPPDLFVSLSFLAIVAAWSVLHWSFRDVVIYHDNWLHNFPFVFAVAKSSSCGNLASWLMWPDSGSPTSAYLISYSLTNPIRIVLLNIFACARLEPFAALLVYKTQVYVIYLGFAVGMAVLGKTLFQSWLSVLYIFAATLFAGFCLDAAHSDQVAILVFWAPWFVAAAALADRHAGEIKGTFYANGAVLFFCGALVDQYPHFAIVAGATGGSFYAYLRFERLKLLLAQWRQLWPTVIFLGITAAQLLFILGKFTNYVPSLRASIVVDPSQFGVTGFMQPSALFGLLFPLTFTAAFDQIASGFGPMGSRSFIYYIDILILYGGTFPLLLAIGWFVRAGQKTLKIGWLGFTVVLLLISLQQSGLYFILFHIPLFDVFRSYFLFVPYVMFGFLVISGYGFERLVIGERLRRRDQLGQTQRFGYILFAVAAVLLVAVIGWSGLGWGILDHAYAILGDTAIIGAAFALLFILWRYPGFHPLYVTAIITTLILTQSLYAVVIYRTLGISAAAAFERYELTPTMLTPYSAVELSQPEKLRRVACPTFGSCYLALRDAASLRRDLDGTFLRHRSNPIFQNNLTEGVKSALAGVTHAFIWPSISTELVPSITALNDILDAHEPELPQLLRKSVFIIGDSEAKKSAEATQPARVSVSLSDLERTTDRISLRYRADGNAFVNLGITYDRYWRATVNGNATSVFPGNYGTATVNIPSGGGVLELRYNDPFARLLFWSRNMVVGLELLMAIYLGVTISRPRRRD